MYICIYVYIHICIPELGGLGERSERLMSARVDLSW